MVDIPLFFIIPVSFVLPGFFFHGNPKIITVGRERERERERTDGE